MKMWTTFSLTIAIVTAFGGVAANGADFQFRNHFIERDLPVERQDHWRLRIDRSCKDIDRDGHLDFVMGGRPFQPSQLYWFEYQTPDRWVRHFVGSNYLSDVGLAALDVDGDGWPDLVCSGVWYRNPGKPRDLPFERIMFDDDAASAHDNVVTPTSMAAGNRHYRDVMGD